MEGRGVCVITGGSGGIGAAIARRVAAAGWTPCISYRQAVADAEQLADELGGVAIRADVTSSSDLARLFNAAAELGPVTAAVANAGVVAPASRLVDMSDERIRSVVEINVVGTLLTARAAIRAFSTNDRPCSLVLVSSIAATLGSPGEYVDYAASKGAVDSLALGLAREVAGEGVRVNAVRPGIIDTPIHARSGRPDRAWDSAPVIPLGRPGDPDEVAALVAWLLGPEASYVTGAIVDVGGGR